MEHWFGGLSLPVSGSLGQLEAVVTVFGLCSDGVSCVQGKNAWGQPERAGGLASLGQACIPQCKGIQTCS